MTVMLDMPRRAAPAASTTPATPCAADPDRWLNSGNDPQVKALCRLQCPRRFACAAEALNIPYPQGISSGCTWTAMSRRARAPPACANWPRSPWWAISTPPAPASARATPRQLTPLTSIHRTQGDPDHDPSAPAQGPHPRLSACMVGSRPDPGISIPTPDPGAAHAAQPQPVSPAPPPAAGPRRALGTDPRPAHRHPRLPSPAKVQPDSRHRQRHRDPPDPATAASRPPRSSRRVRPQPQPHRVGRNRHEELRLPPRRTWLPAQGAPRPRRRPPPGIGDSQPVVRLRRATPGRRRTGISPAIGSLTAARRVSP